MTMQVQTSKKFDQNCTMLCKGIAIIWMMYHHLVPYTEFTSGPVIAGIYLPGVIALTGKVCVTIFLFLSAYGLTKSAKKVTSARQMVKFTWKHIKKIYLTYWMVFCVFTLIGMLFYRDSFLYLTQSPMTRVKNLLSSFSGWQYFIGHTGYQGYNPAWWYISLCLLLYLVFPFLLLLLRTNMPLFLLLTVGIYVSPVQIDGMNPVISQLMYWGAPYMTGMIVAETDLHELVSPTRKTAVISFVSAIALAILRYIGRNKALIMKLDLWITLLIAVAVFAWTELDSGKAAKRVLYFLGYYSFEIYLIHLFVTNMYTTPIIYGINDATWMVIATLLITGVAAIVIRALTTFASTSPRKTKVVFLSLLCIGLAECFISKIL